MRKIMVSIIVFLCFFVNCTSVLAIEQSKKIHIPRRYDLRDKGKLNATKSNGRLSTSWELGATDWLETSLFATRGERYKFSWKNINTQNTDEYTESYDRRIYSMGNMQMLAGYLTSWRGPVLESEDSGAGYDSYEDDFEDYNYVTGTKAQKHIQEILFLPEIRDPKNTDYIKENILKYGSVQAKVWIPVGEVGSKFYNVYKKSWNFNGDEDAYKESPHNITTVTIIGWDDDYSMFNFKNKPSGNGAWIVKAHEGTIGYITNDPDKGGYVNISYYDSTIGKEMESNVAMCVASGIEEKDNYDNIYQHDLLGYNSRIKVDNKDNKSIFANTFTINEKESLAAVSFYTLEKDVSYKIFITESKLAGKEEIEKIQVAEGSFEEMGYHTVKLDEEITLDKGKKSFIVELQGRYKTPLIAMDSRDSEYDNNTISNVGESYIFKNEEFLDLKNMKEIQNSRKQANVCLKIFTQKSYGLLLPEQMKGEIEYILDSMKKYHPVISEEGFSQEQKRIIEHVRAETKKPTEQWRFSLMKSKLMGMLKDGQSRIIYNPIGRKLNMNLIFSENFIRTTKIERTSTLVHYISYIGGKTREELLELLLVNGLAFNESDAEKRAEELLLDEYVLRHLDLVNDDGTVDVAVKLLNNYIIENNGNTIDMIFRVGFVEREEKTENDNLDGYEARIEKANNLAYFKLEDHFGKKDLKDELILANKEIKKWIKDIIKLEIENVALDLRNANPYSKYIYENIEKYLKGKDLNIYVMISHETKGKSIEVVNKLEKNSDVKIVGTSTGGNYLESGILREGLLPYTMDVFQLWSKGKSQQENYIIGESIKPHIEVKSDLDYKRLNGDQTLEIVRRNVRDDENLIYVENGILEGNYARCKIKYSKDNEKFYLNPNNQEIYIPFEIYEVEKIELIDSKSRVSRTLKLDNSNLSFRGTEKGLHYISILHRGKKYLTPIQFKNPVKKKVEFNDESNYGVLDERSSYTYNNNEFGVFAELTKYSGEGFEMTHDQGTGEFIFLFDQDAKFEDFEKIELNIDGEVFNPNLNGFIIDSVKKPYIGFDIPFDSKKKYILRVPKEIVTLSDGSHLKKNIHVDLKIKEFKLNHAVKAYSYYTENGELRIMFNKQLEYFNNEGLAIIDSSGNSVQWNFTDIYMDSRTVIINLKDEIILGEEYKIYLPKNSVKSYDGEIMSHEIDENFIVR